MVFDLVFKKLFGNSKKAVISKPAIRKPIEAPSATPEEISRLFISTLLNEDSRQNACYSNELDQKLTQEVLVELAQFNIDSIPKIAQSSVSLMERLIDPAVSSNDIVSIIKEDPVLLGKLLQSANSAFYKNSENEIKSIEDAIVRIGNDGVRKLVINSLLANQLKISTIYFEYFGFNIWQHSIEVATMAAKYAREQGENEFKAYLNGLIHDVGKLMIFRLLIKVLDQEPPDTYPSKHFFAKIIDRHSHQLTLAAINEWGLPLEWIKPTLMYRSNLPLEEMDTDGKALFISNHCSEFYRLTQLELIDDKELSALLNDRAIEFSLYQGLVSSL